ncbi:aminotransferase class III-fold pyridoxal phosphate-dependent enzyme [Novosphingobium flavum]|uniref:Aminotransferase class III-fold pyridoxal phosphate-dependent enzyme n=1 Tax=Novosphingobium flavum TaxID=1778672 RepID=A0A7X1FPR1_9SPHN|nr:aminotransferase class III-fold pyridoxal phosphate-dependent enzyme [Novosphingobium flavum]MBC2664292.1 aminotransferase class III-fold pyridoxal phosphate-dependent enzyme [Novosphingobium flavum]
MVRARTNDLNLVERAAKVLPAGVYGHHSVGMLPSGYPQFFGRAVGARLWDVDGNEYIDYLCGYGTNLFGYGFEPVEQAAAEQRRLGDTMTGPSALMVELAEAFVDMVAHADWAMFCKNGSDATMIALMTARAHTGNATVLVADGAYHGAMPWCTPRQVGVIPADRAHVVTYRYNDAASLRAAFEAHRGDVAAVFAAPYRHDVYADQEDLDLDYAQTARELCDASGALLVVDDVRAGFRIARDCSWAHTGIEPDISAWGKCFANGHPISAVLGNDKARKAAADIYVTGSYWFSAVPMAAALATLRQIRETDYLEKMIVQGQRLRDGLDRQAADQGFALSQTGPAQMPQILFRDDPDFVIGFNWAQLCIEHGVYFHPFHNMFLSHAHDGTVVDETLRRTGMAFEALRGSHARLSEGETSALKRRIAERAASSD